jgi:hypothetical protein
VVSEVAVATVVILRVDVSADMLVMLSLKPTCWHVCTRDLCADRRQCTSAADAQQAGCNPYQHEGECSHTQDITEDHLAEWRQLNMQRHTKDEIGRRGSLAICSWCPVAVPASHTHRPSPRTRGPPASTQ